MTIQIIGVTAAWLAGFYRLWVSFRRPATVWRTSFTGGIVCAAAGLTFQTFSPEIDAWTRPSIATLLNHLVTIIGLACVQVYVATLRSEDPPPVARAAAVAVVGEALTITSWVMSKPFHVGERDHFGIYAADPWVAIYFWTFWALIGLTMAQVARFCLFEQRGAAPEDRARVVSLALIGLGAAGGLLYAISAAVGTLYIVIKKVADRGPLMLSSIVLAPSVALLGIGILALLVVPPADARIRAHYRLKVIRPFWRDLLHAAPQVGLKGADRSVLRPLTTAERSVIEIRDALNAIKIHSPSGLGVEALAVQLYDRLHGGDGEEGRIASVYLPARGTQIEDAAQIYSLAHAYVALRDGARGGPDAPQPSSGTRSSTHPGR